MTFDSFLVEALRMSTKKRAYFEALDLTTNCFQERFDQPRYSYQVIETLLLKASKKEELKEALDTV